MATTLAINDDEKDNVEQVNPTSDADDDAVEVSEPVTICDTSKTIAPVVWVVNKQVLDTN